jgi:hypothetical protein
MAYSGSSQITASRSMSSYNVKYGDTVTVTVTISVGSILGTSLRGFYLTEYVPWAYPVIKDTVTLNGVNSNSRIKRESISTQANYPGFGLQRWVLETPTAWTENNPINPMSTLIIKYKYVFPVDAPSTTLSLPGFSWVAVDPTQGDVGDVFGYEDSPPSLKITGNPLPTRMTIKAATASSMENGSVGPSMAIDNDPTTRWSSAFTNNEWIVFDLGAPYSIKGVVLVWETASGQTYKIQGSNDAAFGGTPAELYNYTAAVCGAKTDSLVITAGGSYRYVRMLGLTRCTGFGYSIYEARIYASSAVSASAPPTVATAAAASPATVTGATTNLSVLGADDGGEAALTYTWATTGTPPASVNFSVNGTNGAKNTVATFTKAGAYNLQATIKDADNQTVTSSVAVTVNQTQTVVTVAPASATVNVNATQQFTATAADQFGLAMSPQPTFSWAVSGGGAISAGGLFTAGATAGGPYSVTATAGSQSGTGSITVTAPNSPPTVATAAAATPSPVAGTTTNLSVLGADDGGEAALTYTWATTGTPPAVVSFSVNGTNGAKNCVATFTKAGSYGFQVTIKDAQNAVVTSAVSVTVNQTQTAVTVAPASATVNINAAQQFTANASDQFGAAMSPQPAFTWTVSGGGTISASGLFTAGATAGGPYTATATAGSQSAAASVTVSATVLSTKLTIASATASSLQGADLAAGYAIDGNAGTRWGSAFTDNEWILFDLGAAYNVTGVVFVWEAAAGKEYRVQAGNDPAFGGTPFELYHFIGAAGCGARTDSLTVNSGGTTYRYIRMLGVSRCTGWGYSIWEARIYGSTSSVPNNPPTVATAAAALPNPVVGTTTTLSVLGADDGGEVALTYTWATTGTPPAAVIFSVNGTNAAKNTVATFTKAGSYGLQVTIKDAQNATATSAVSVTVNQTQTAVTVAPASATVNINAAQQFTANANDQFGLAMSPQPSFGWTVSGGGAISAGGLFTAGATAGGPYTVTATSGSQSASASVTVSATVTLTKLTITAATASSLQGADLAAGYAIDGNAGTRWSSAFSDPQSITFDLGSAKTVTKVVLVWEAASGSTYRIQGSNDPAFGTSTDLYGFSIAAPCGARTDSLTLTTIGTFRYVRMLGQARCTGWGYSIWEARIYGSSAPLSFPPAVASPAAASPNPVTLKTANLSVLGADDNGEPALMYAWAATGTPPAAVSFSANGTNAAKNTIATFTKAGSYTLQATITDADGQSVSSSVTVTVSQTQTSVSVTPTSATIATSATQQFTASAVDQFGAALSPQPAFGWAVSGGGTISATGLFTAGIAAGGPYTVTATAGSLSGTASVTVTTTVASSKLAIASATASSVENAGTLASYAIDGNAGTRWSSAFTNSEWITFDLGAPRNVTAAVFVWEAAAGQDYKVQASNDPAFAGTPVDLIRKTVTSPCGARTDSLNVVSGGAFRYVRMLGINRCIGYGYSIWEARLYGY